MSSQFKSSLAFGKVAETAIARWLISRGNHVLPAYEIEENKFQGPQLFGKNKNYVTPDLLAFNSGSVVWIEAKHKTAFAWHRKTKQWTTGVDRHHWKDYVKVAEVTRMPCWLLFNHTGGTAKDSPPSPSGLYGNEIRKLKDCIDHEHDNWGRHGMVYWAIDSLVRFCDCLR